MIKIKVVRKAIKNGDLLTALTALQEEASLRGSIHFLDLAEYRLNQIETLKIGGVMSLDDYMRKMNELTADLLRILPMMERPGTAIKIESMPSTESPPLPSKEVKRKWRERYAEKKSGELVSELREKERIVAKIPDEHITDDIKEDVAGLKSFLTKELEYLYEYLPREKFKEVEEATYVGIDFGTTNTVVSYMVYMPDRENMHLSAPSPFSLLQDKEIAIPTCLFYDKVGKTLLFGSVAKGVEPDRQRPEINFWSNFKTKLGLDVGNIYHSSELPRGSKEKTILNPEDATSVYLEWLINKIKEFVAKKKLPTKIHYSLSVPASFSSNKRQAYLRILDKLEVSIEGAVLIDEPNAAFLSYLLSQPLTSLDALQRKHILVYDFGGGTCDVSIVEFWKLDNGRIASKNYSTSSDNKIGGDSIDFEIAHRFLLPIFLEAIRLKDEYVSSFEKEYLVLKLKPIAEALKIRACEKLSSTREELLLDKKVGEGYTLSLDFRGNKYEVKGLTIFYKEFISIMKQIIQTGSRLNIVAPINSALKNAKMRNTDIDAVMLIGGSCKNPYVRKMLERVFPDADILQPKDLQTHVAYGTAANTALIHGTGRSIMDPIVSESISVMLKDESFFELIRAGTEVPSLKRSYRNFRISKDRQDTIEIPVYATGEKRMLANFRIKGDFSRENVFDLFVYVDENKQIMLDVKMRLEGEGVTANKSISTFHFMPFSHETLSEYRRKLKELEKSLYTYVSMGFSATYKKVEQVIHKMVELHELNNNHREALDLLITFAPHLHTGISYHASKCREYEVCMDHSRMAYEKNPNPVTLFNYALRFDDNSQEREDLMRQASDMGDIDAQYRLGELLVRKGRTEGLSLIDSAFQKMLEDYNQDKLDQPAWRYNQLLELADRFNDNNLKQEILATLKEKEVVLEVLTTKKNKDNMLER